MGVISRRVCCLSILLLNSAATAFVTRPSPSKINNCLHNRQEDLHPSSPSSSTTTLLLQSSLNKESSWNASNTAIAESAEDYAVYADFSHSSSSSSSDKSQIVENGTTEFIDERSILEARRQYKEGYYDEMVTTMTEEGKKHQRKRQQKRQLDRGMTISNENDEDNDTKSNHQGINYAKIIDHPYFPPVSDESSIKFDVGSQHEDVFTAANIMEEDDLTRITIDDDDTKKMKQQEPSTSNIITKTNKKEILSSIIHAAMLGSQKTIRRSSSSIGISTTSDDKKKTRFSTTATTTARRVIASSLLASIPNLNIVGISEEEDINADDDDNAVARSVDANVELMMMDDLLDEYDDWTTIESSSESAIYNSDDDLALSELDMNQLEVYIDVLDGRNDIEEELDAVTCSIGVCYKGRPIMGAIVIPFKADDERYETEVVFGVVGKGAGMVKGQRKKLLPVDGSIFENLSLSKLKQHDSGDTIKISSSGDSDIVRAALDVADKIFPTKEGQIVRQNVEAAGIIKFLKVILGQTTLSILDDKTSMCETAAPTAILEAIGGKVTDYFGEPLIYNPNSALGNKLGVFATAPGIERERLQLESAMRADKNCLSLLEPHGLKNDDDTTAAQCVDIVRDLDGYPLPVQYFADKLNIKNAVSYSCPEQDAFRGLMSNACRVHIFPGGETAFYKRIVFENLDHAKEKLKTAPYKLTTDAESYRVVTSFLSSKACREVTEKAGVRIPKLLDVKLEPNDSNPIESKFSFLLEDLAPKNGWYLRWLLQEMDECKATLSALAKIHAFFWDGSSFWNDADAAKELEASVWKSASYVQPSRNLNHCKRVAKRWVTERLKCEKELSSLDYWDNLGVRLESISEDFGKMAHPFAEDDTFSAPYKKFRTFTHGDPKQANLLFRRSSGESELEVGMIDYQWAGFGLAASDVSHFMTSAVHADMLLDGGEDILLRYYYDELQKYLVEFGAYRDADDVILNFSYDTFMEQYETGVIDMCRLVVSYTWRRWDPVEKDDKVGCARTMNKNSYSKSIPNIVWLLSRCDDIMKSRGV